MNDDLENYFEHETRAIEWRNLRVALTGRLRALKEARARATRPDDIAALDKQIDAMEGQIDVLRIEEAAQQFYEDSVRVTVNAHVLRHADELDDENTVD